MKPAIAILSRNYRQYSETFIANMVERLPFDVHLLHTGDIPAYDRNGKELLPSGKWRRVKYAVLEAVAGISTEQMKLQAVEEYLLKNNIKAVLANYTLTAFPVMDICVRNKIPLMVHEHGWTAYRQTILDAHQQELQQLFTKATAIVVVSADMRKQFIRLGAPESKLRQITYGPHPELFRYSDHSGKPPVFLAVGRFCDTKNPHLTILAFSKVLNDLPDARLVMVGGDENLLCACINLCKALGIGDKVNFKGALTPEQVAEEMKNAYAFVQHSAATNLNEKEGTPVAILEAMASGLPVISTRHGGIQEIINDGQTGLLCNEFDVISMAESMKRIVLDKNMAREIGKQAAEEVQKNYSMRIYIDKLSGVIEEAMKNAGNI